MRQVQPRRAWIAVLATLILGLLAADVTVALLGLAEEDSPAPPPPGPPVPPRSLVAQAVARSVSIYRAPGATTPVHSLRNPNDNGAPLVFLVHDHRGDWLGVVLPVGLNGSTGWIRAGEVKLSQHGYRVVVELAAHRVTVFADATVVLTEPVGLGARDRPPPGDYYIKELLRPPDANGVYGMFAYGLSGFSNHVTDVGAGRGLVGIHGTNDASSLGRDVSLGSIHMSNAGISRLATFLPLGTPVHIRP
jgi:lipoprotein-anchoring transpeptidase ErfK/SrfK